VNSGRNVFNAWPMFCIRSTYPTLLRELNVSAPKVKGSARYFIESRSMFL